MNVLVVYDRDGWTFHYEACQLQRRLADAFTVQIQSYTVPIAAPPDVLIAYWYPSVVELARQAPDARIITVMADEHTWCTHAVAYGALLDAITRSAAVVVPTRRLADLLLPAFHVAAPRLEVIRAGVDFDDFYAERGVVAPFRVGWAGSALHADIKGVDAITAALQDLGVECALARREDVWRGPQAMRVWYNTLSCYCSFSVCEGTGKPLLEAAACGIPWVSPIVGAAPELFSDALALAGAPAGVLIPRLPAALQFAVRQLHEDPSRAAAMGAAGQVAVTTRWRWDQRADRFRELIAGLL